MNIIAYLVLLIILLVVLCIIGILAVFFHSCILSWCCTKFSSGSESEGETSGRRNVAFNDQDEAAVIRPRPFNSMEQVETPPSYEEAVQQETFRFRPPLLSPQWSAGENSNRTEIAQPAASSSSSSTIAHNHAASSNSPTHQRHRVTRPRSSTACSSASANLPLTTINEEDDECPIQVVIDCIGVQTARLIEKCETTVQLTNGQELKTNSTC